VTGEMTAAELDSNDRELIDAAHETRKRLYLKGRHEVASALRTTSGEIFAGIHIEADVGFADVCGEVAAICHALAHGHQDTMSELGDSGESIGAVGGDTDFRPRLLVGFGDTLTLSKL